MSIAFRSLVRDAMGVEGQNVIASFARVAPRYASNRESLVASILEEISDAEIASELVRNARETSTHYVWPLHLPGFAHPGIYLNEFKESPGRGYANVIHNHRYDFVTIVLAGGYTQESYEVRIDDETHGPARVQRTSVGRLRAGQWMLVDHADFHRLVDILPDTFTLLVKGAPRRDRSISVDVTTGVVSEHVPVENRIRQLRKRLTVARDAIEATPAGGRADDA